MRSTGSERSTAAFGLQNFPPETLLHILSYLDIPDLVVVGEVLPLLKPLTEDPVLHHYRLRIVSPSRVNHNLFGTSPAGHAFRPTLLDLVHRGVIKGLGIERRWRMGISLAMLLRDGGLPFDRISDRMPSLIIFSPNWQSITQYENSRALSRRHASHVVSLQLRRRLVGASNNHSLQTLHSAHVMPDVESSSLNVARSLLPIMRKLKWSRQRDELARSLKSSVILGGLVAWLDSEEGRRVFPDSEKVRLALCPDIRKKVNFYEHLVST